MSNKYIIRMRTNYYKLKNKKIMNKLLEHLASRLIFIGCFGVVAFCVLNFSKEVSDVGMYCSFIIAGVGSMVHLCQMYRNSKGDGMMRYILILLMILTITVLILCPTLEMTAIWLSITLLEMIAVYLLLATVGIVALGGVVAYIVWLIKQ